MNKSENLLEGGTMFKKCELDCDCDCDARESQSVTARVDLSLRRSKLARVLHTHVRSL